MSDYFDQVEQGMREAVRRRAHLPWYARSPRIRRGRALVVVLAALVVATPAVGAVTNWFGIGAPDHFPAQSPTLNDGRALPRTSQLLALRVPDPAGGPPWGMRLVRSTRGETCIQLGRVENGRIGSLGIDGAWHNDGLLHPFPITTIDDYCAATDAAGNAFENVGESAFANAYPATGTSRSQAGVCELGCPGASMRIVFMGLLGPDATRITYRAPDGSLRTEKTSVGDGAYLLVFPLDDRNCSLYSQGPYGGNSGCAPGDTGSSPEEGIGAITAISYRDGHVCSLHPSRKLLAANRAFKASAASYLRAHPSLARHLQHPSARQEAVIESLRKRLLASEHLTPADLLMLTGLARCPRVGYVAEKEKPLTRGEVATPISAKVLPATQAWAGVVRVDITFIARQPVTTTSSWYEFYIAGPSCPGGGSGVGGQIGVGNIRAGQQIHYQALPADCKGVYHGLIGYMQDSEAANVTGGVIPGKDGSILVGRVSFTIH
jgi:hypothetical protein